jgi:hypothetical protein
MTEAAWFNPAINLDLFLLLVENSRRAAIPPHPDLLADEFGWHFVKGACHFDVAVTMDVALGFLETGKKRVGQ